MILIEQVTKGPSELELISLVLLPALYCFFMYFRSKISLITIQYAGGEIGFDKRWFTTQEIEMFQKQLRMAKDRSIEESENSVANKMEQAIITMSSQAVGNNRMSKIEELAKLGELLEKGIITKEEFDSMKRELM